MGKNKKNKYRKEEDRENMRQSYNAQNHSPRAGSSRDERGDGRQIQTKKPEYHPVALLLRDEFTRQINTFLDGEINEQTASQLFNLTSYPARLIGCDEADNYLAFQLDKNVQLSRDDAQNLRRLSTIVLVQDINTHLPAFLVQAFISPNRSAKIIIHECGPAGTYYWKTLRWSRD